VILAYQKKKKYLRR